MSSSPSVKMLSKHPNTLITVTFTQNTQSAFQPCYGYDLSCQKLGKNNIYMLRCIYVTHNEIQCLVCNHFSLLGYLLVEPVGCGLCKWRTGVSCHMLDWYQTGMNISGPIPLKPSRVSLHSER